MGLGLEREHVALVLAAVGGRLGLVERPLVDREDRLPRLRLRLGAELHALGQDDLLLRGQQRHTADLAQVQADGIVGVQDLGLDGNHLGVRLRPWRQRRAPDLGLRDARMASASSTATSGSSSTAAAASAASTSEVGGSGVSNEITMLQLQVPRPTARPWVTYHVPVRGPAVCRATPPDTRTGVSSDTPLAY